MKLNRHILFRGEATPSPIPKIGVDRPYSQKASLPPLQNTPIKSPSLRSSQYVPASVPEKLELTTPTLARFQIVEDKLSLRSNGNEHKSQSIANGYIYKKFN